MVAVPALPLDPAGWSDAAIGRAGCFGRATIRFDAIGGGAMNTTPGILLPASLGSTYLWFSLRKTTPGSNDITALLPPGHLASAEDQALERTWNPEPGVGWGGGTWWRVAGHFADPGAQECRSGGAWYLDSTLIEYTSEQAIEVCRELFVVESLEWLTTAPASG